MRVQEETPDKSTVLLGRMQALTSVGVEFVHDVVVSAREHKFRVVAEFDGREATVLTGEFLGAAPRVQVPEFGDTVAGSRDQEVAAELHGVDGAAVARQCADVGARGAVPDVDCEIFGAGDDVFCVEADVEDAAGVLAEAVERLVVFAGDVPNYAGVIARAGHHDGIVVLEAEDAGFVVVVGDVVDGVAFGGAVDTGVVNYGVFVRVESGLHFGDGNGFGAADDFEAFVGFHAPDADCAVAGAGYNFVLVKLTAVDRIGMAIQVDSVRSSSFPSSIDCPSHLVHRPPILTRSTLSMLEFSDSCTTH